MSAPTQRPSEFPRLRQHRACSQKLLQTYANLMADGNIVFCDDFQRGVLMDQYDVKREFLAEYRSLPDIGMTKPAGMDDPVALWRGVARWKEYFTWSTARIIRSRRR